MDSRGRRRRALLACICAGKIAAGDQPVVAIVCRRRRREGFGSSTAEAAPISAAVPRC